MDWQLEKLGVAMTLVRRQEGTLLGYVQIMGQSIGETSWAQPSLALAASLIHLDKILITNSEWCNMLDPGGEIVVYTGYDPILSEDQLKRWKIYGSPSQPSPAQKELDEILRR